MPDFPPHLLSGIFKALNVSLAFVEGKVSVNLSAWKAESSINGCVDEGQKGHPFAADCDQHQCQ